MGKVDDEGELLRQIANGDAQAFEILFKSFRSRVYSLASRLVQSATIAEEITQDVFLKLWIKRVELVQIQSFEAYITIVVRNQAFNALKMMARYQEIIHQSGNSALLFEQNVQELLIQKDYANILQQAVSQLPPQQKLVYRLIKEEGLNRQAVAEQMGLSADTVKYYLALAMRAIRAYCLARIEFCVLMIVFFA